MKRYFKYMALAAAATLLVFVLPSGKAVDVPDEHVERTPYPVTHIYAEPGYRSLVDSAANVIVDSSGVMLRFFHRLESLQRGDDRVVSILHIGDSHVQAGFLTGRLRDLFQDEFGNAGPGLITPYKLAGMNEPRNYSITTPYGRKTAKATDQGLKENLGFTGVSVTFETPYNEFKIWEKQGFSGITVFHHRRAPRFRQPRELDAGINCTIEDTPWSTRIVLSQKVDSVVLSTFVRDTLDTPSYYGFMLDNGQPGVLYNAVGLNSASFEHFYNNTRVAQGDAWPLHPDIIIISLGTNNCYGNNFVRENLEAVVDRFLSSVMENYPGVPVLMTTPMESCRRVRNNRTPNPNICVATDVIEKAAAAHGAASWNLYNAAGGDGAMDSWFKAGLAQRDMIHMTENGYILQADMLYDALMLYFNANLLPIWKDDEVHQTVNIE